MDDFDENNITEETQEAEPEEAAENAEGIGTSSVAPEQKHCGFSRALNKYFHHIDRGSSLKTEVTAGIFICIMTVCAMFMNIQLLSSVTLTGTTAENGEVIASMWFWTMIIACAGSVLMGLVARLPFTQTSGLGLSSVMMTMVGYTAGITYYNLLAICFLASLVYTAIVAVPKVRDFIYNAIPASVRKAVPVAMGLIIAFVAIQLSGIVSFGGDLLSTFGAGAQVGSGSVATGSILGFGIFSYSTDKYYPTLLLAFLFALVAIVLILIFRARKAKHPYLWPLLICTGAFLIVYFLTTSINWTMMSLTYDSLWGRAWMLGGEDTMLAHLSNAVSGISFGKIFTEGFDFSGCEGSAALVFITGMFTMIFTFMFHADAVCETSAENAGFGEKEQKSMKIAYICNAGTNVVSSIFGVAPVEISPENHGGTEEGGKSGIVPIVAAIGFLISAFFWVIPALFSTYNSPALESNLYGHYGVVMEMLTESGFAIADAVMVVMGLSMAVHGLKKVDWKDWTDFVPFLAAVAVAFFTSCIAYGVAAGVVVVLIIRLVKKPAEGVKKIEEIKAITVADYVVAAIMLILLILALIL